MNSNRLDDFARNVGRRGLNRRAVLAATAASALVGAFGRREAMAGVGCRDVGKACRRGEECCSGLCKGKRGKRTCRPHGVGTCEAGADYCRQGKTATCNFSDDCHCVATTGGARFCGATSGSVCMGCQSDADCDPVTGPGSACVAAIERPFCACDTFGFSTACVARCGVGPNDPLR
jgi:hypothetical protein